MDSTDLDSVSAEFASLGFKVVSHTILTESFGECIWLLSYADASLRLGIDRFGGLDIEVDVGNNEWWPPESIDRMLGGHGEYRPTPSVDEQIEYVRRTVDLTGGRFPPDFASRLRSSARERLRNQGAEED